MPQADEVSCFHISSSQIAGSPFWLKADMVGSQYSDDGVIETYALYILAIDPNGDLCTRDAFRIGLAQVDIEAKQIRLTCPDLYNLEDWLRLIGVNEVRIKTYVELILEQYTTLAYSTNY